MREAEIRQCLKRAGHDHVLKHSRTLTSSVTTAWGVQWDEVYIARDLMQNFFDANRDCLAQVIVQAHGSDVVVTAPIPFNLQRLFYLGSEKGEDDVGQYGEGFKAAATCLLRDHDVTPIAISGNDLVAMRVAENAVEGTALFPVEYDFYHLDRPRSGTVLVLPGCSKKLIQALREGMNHFFFERNPLLGQNLWSSYRGADFSIYASKDGRGHVFYRKLKRGQIEGIPIVLVIDKKYEAIEKEVSKDRDRNAFGEKIMQVFYSHFSRFALNGNSTAQSLVVQAARQVWIQGHPLLSTIAENSRCWPDELAKQVFQEKYYARSRSTGDLAEQLQIEQLERAWEKKGLVLLPQYFSKFGVPSARDEIQRIREKAQQESIEKNRRAPTSAESRAIELLRTVLRSFAPDIDGVIRRKDCTYTVAETDAVLGELRTKRSYHSIEVFLAESVFVSDFPRALLTFLHEHAHIFGYDASRGFTDALTELLETVIRQRSDLDPFEKKWQKGVAGIKSERAISRKRTDEQQGWIQGLTESQLRELIQRVPPVVLDKLRTK